MHLRKILALLITVVMISGVISINGPVSVMANDRSSTTVNDSIFDEGNTEQEDGAADQVNYEYGEQLGSSLSEIGDLNTAHDTANQMTYDPLSPTDEVLELLSSGAMYSSLEEEQIELLFNYYGLREDVMLELEQSGFDIAESLIRAEIMQLLNISALQVEELISAQGSIESALCEARSLADYQYKNSFFSGDSAPELTALIIRGYKAREAVFAYVASYALSVDVEAILSPPNTYAASQNLVDDDENSAGLNLDEESLSELNSVAGCYYLDAFGINDYAVTNGLGYNEIAAKIINFRLQNNITLYPEESAAAAGTETLTQKYPSAPFLIQKSINENINMNTGSLIYEDTIATIPGRAGVDLNLTMQYDHDMACPDELTAVLEVDEIQTGTRYEVYGDQVDHIYLTGTRTFYREQVNVAGMYLGSFSTYSAAWDFGMAAWYVPPHWRLYYPTPQFDSWVTKTFDVVAVPIYGITYNYKNVATKKDTTVNPMRFMGSGWALKFDRMMFVGNDKYIRFASGSTFRIEADGSLYNYALKGVSLKSDSGTFTASRYVLSFPDGRKEYFDIDGNIVAMANRFSDTKKGTNAIKFKYENISGTYTKQIAITDTMGVMTYIKYNNNKVQFLLPDSSTIEYDLRSDNGYKYMDRKKDQAGLFTSYIHETSVMPFMFENTETRGVYTVLALKRVDYPNGVSTTYVSSPRDGRLGYNGLYYYYIFLERYDRYSGNTYSRVKYSYEGNYQGYPNSFDEDGPKYGYTYGVTSENDIGVRSKTTFDYRHLKISEEASRKTGSSYAQFQKMEFTYDYVLKLPVKVVTTTYGSSSFSATELYEYDDFGNVTAYWNPMANGNKSQVKFKTQYTYYDSYNLPYVKAYWKDNNTEIVEANLLSSNGKAFSGYLVEENRVVKEKTDLVYNSDGSLSGRYRYNWPSQSADEFEEISYSYTDLTFKGYALPFRVFSTTNHITYYAISEFEYDSMWRVKKSYDAKRNETSYEYDAYGRVTKQTNPDGSYVTNVYDTVNNKITRTDENGVATVYSYDGFGNIVDVKQAGSSYSLARYTYDSMLRLIEERDAEGNVTKYTYDYLGRVESKTMPDNLYKETYTYDNAYDSNTSRIVKTVEGDANSPAIKSAVYTDKYGRNIKNSVFDGTNELFDSYTYDYVGNKLQELSAKDASLGRAFTAKYEYDYSGKLIKTTNYLNESITATYNGLGRKSSVTDPKGNVSYYTYDCFGRLVKEKLPFDGNYFTIKTYDYDLGSNLLEQSVSNNKPGEADSASVTKYYYDKRNRLVKTEGYDGANAKITATYEYDALGNTVKMTTADGAQITSYEYDSYGRMTKLTDPMGMFETYSYDKSGNMISKIDRNDVETVTVYDKLNRPVSISAEKDGYTCPEFMNYAYTKTGALKTEQNENLTTTNVYDAFGRLLTQTESTGTEKKYSYDLAGNRTGFILKRDGAVVFAQVYTYDVLNRLLTVSDNDGPAATYEYDKNGNRSKLTYPNGVYATYEYNKANLVTKLTNLKSNGAQPAVVLSSYSYTYLLDGNQSSKLEAAGENTEYKYDGLGRLKEEKLITGTATLLTTSYAYDKAGNRSSKIVVGNGAYAAQNATSSYQYDLNNRLVREDYTRVDRDVSKQTGKIIYGYDANGNQISEKQYDVAVVSIDPPIWHSNFFNLDDMTELEQISITGKNVSSEVYYELDDEIDMDLCFDLVTEKYNAYDVFNRLVAIGSVDIETEDITVLGEYSYKAGGLRISKTIDGITTRQIWDGSSISLELEGDAILNKYTRGINLIKDDSSFFMYNAHGDVVQLLNTSGIITKSYKYDAFGNERNISESDTNPWRYCGEYFDKETGKVYLRARYYDPATSRMLSEDPIKDGLNWYTYCYNNPVMFFHRTALA